MTVIKQWINSEYTQIFEQNRHEELCTHSPFPHVVLDDFFRKPVIDNIVRSADQAVLSPSNAKYGLSIGTQIHWGPFSDLSVVRFICGQEFRGHLGKIFGVTPKLIQGFVPQINAFQPGSRGFAIHNDADEPKQLVMLINLNDEIPADGGGELCLYSRENRRFVPKVISVPQKNRLVCFLVSKDSWHGVNDLKGSWTRKNVIFDWQVA